MSKETNDFRMGFLLDHEHTIELLKLSLRDNLTPIEMLYEMIDEEWFRENA